jgi:hypothetical protein
MITNSKLKILISTHKQFAFPENDFYLPVHAGKKNSNINLKYQGDDLGDNISDKNTSYCELTTMYWAWKNLKELEYIGLCHYRRYFLFNKFLQHQLKRFNHNSSEFFALKGVLNVNDTIFKKFDFILSEPLRLGRTIYDDYALYHNKLDFDVLGEVIQDLCSEYYISFTKLFYSSSQLSPYNMFVSSKKNFDCYCNWLFPILFEVEKRIKISEDVYQARVFGFMGERLLNLYIYHNQFKVKYIPVLKIDDEDNTQSMFYRQLKYVVGSANNLINK